MSPNDVLWANQPFSQNVASNPQGLFWFTQIG